MKKVFEGVNRTKLTVRSSMAFTEGLVFEVTNCHGVVSAAGVMPKATGIEIALTVLEAMEAPEGSLEGVAAGCLRNALAERQRDQKLEAEAVELYEVHREIMDYEACTWELLDDVNKRYWIALARKARELGN